MENEIIYISKCRIERIKGPLRRAYLPMEDQPVLFGVHSEIAAHYGVDPASELIDYEQVHRLALEFKPKMIVAGFSAYSGIVDWARFRKIADQVGAYLMVDMAHVSGLIAAGLYPNPVQIADVTTSTTHKTLRGPRGGIILMGKDFENPFGKIRLILQCLFQLHALHQAIVSKVSPMS